MTNSAQIVYNKTLAGILEKNARGYTFTYNQAYLNGKDPKPISQTLPLSALPYHNSVLFSFFDGLIPEGWLLNIASNHWKIKNTDRFQLLLTLCRDTIGAVTVIPVDEKEVKNE